MVVGAAAVDADTTQAKEPAVVTSASPSRRSTYRSAHPPPPPDGGARIPGPPPPPAVTAAAESRSTAAAWLAGLGVLLLLAAAATFLAVSWDRLDLPARIAIVAAATGGAILTGHRLRGPLPAVGGAVYHLGALLVPVDALALAFHLDAEPGIRWLAVGGTAAAVLPALAVTGRSRTLGWAAVAGVPVAATGLALLGVGPVPATVLAVALLSLLLPALSGPADTRGAAGRLRPVLIGAAPALALTASVLPLVAAVAAAVVAGPGRIAAVAWTQTPWWLLLTVGAGAGGLLLGVAARHRRPTLGALAPVATLSAVVAMWLPGDAPRLAELLALPVLALLIEMAAIGLAGDRVFRAPTQLAARVTEVATAVLTGPAVIVVVLVPTLATTDAEVAAMLATLALFWLAAAVRTVVAPATPPDSATITAPGPATPLDRLELPLFAAAASATVAVGLLFAPTPDVVAMLVLGLAAVALAALLIAPDVPAPLRPSGQAGLAVHALAVTALAVAAAVQAGQAGLLLPGLLGLAAVALAAAAAARHDDVATTVMLGMVAAGLAVLVPLAAGDLVAAWLRVGLLLAVSLAVAPNPVVTLTLRVGAALALPLAVEATGSNVGWDVVERGLSLTAVALIAGIAAVALRGPWRAPLVVTAAAHAVGAWLLLADEPLARAVATLAIGLTVALIGGLIRRPAVAHLGGVVSVLAAFDLLAQQKVEAIDLWLAPVALYLLVAGAVLRRSGASSWVAYVPGLLLLAVPALIERLHDGAGWHAGIAVGAATVAVVAGGVRRLGGPLVVGTVLLVAAMLIEVFAVIAAVPTWVWLALTGALLVGVAILIERHGGSPAVTARRLVDVINDRFA